MWEKRFEQLKRFVDREGHARVPKKDIDESGFGLGSWVNAQRGLRRKGKLSIDRQQALESLQGWVWGAKAAAWEEAYERLVKFVQREGHAKPPTSFKAEDGFRLGGWVNEQRVAYKAGRLSPERIRRLEGLAGWLWSVQK